MEVFSKNPTNPDCNATSTCQLERQRICNPSEQRLAINLQTNEKLRKTLGFSSTLLGCPHSRGVRPLSWITPFMQYLRSLGGTPQLVTKNQFERDLWDQRNPAIPHTKPVQPIQYIHINSFLSFSVVMFEPNMDPQQNDDIQEQRKHLLNIILWGFYVELIG